MTVEPPDEPDVWAPGTPRPPEDQPLSVRRPRPFLLAVCLAVGSVAAYALVGLVAAAWALAHDEDDVAGLARIVLLPLLVVLAVLAGALAAGLLVTAAVQTRAFLAEDRPRILLLWLLPVLALAAWPLRALL